MAEKERKGLVLHAIHPSTTHGANNSQILSAKTEDLAEALIGEYPWFLDTDLVGVMQYCRVEARLRLLTDYMDRIVETEGIEYVPRPILEQISKAETNAMRAAESLGLTPLGRMKIAKDAGFAQHFQKERIGSLLDQGRALREAGKAP
ncbi:MAG: P27 family phage terminase small subunit [Thaumarchaeota archaeon]|nr:P27 family phage terminase small subunit [Nitrososphaerota archaeon]